MRFCVNCDLRLLWIQKSGDFLWTVLKDFLEVKMSWDLVRTVLKCFHEVKSHEILCELCSKAFRKSKCHDILCELCSKASMKSKCWDFLWIMLFSVLLFSFGGLLSICYKGKSFTFSIFKSLKTDNRSHMIVSKELNIVCPVKVEEEVILCLRFENTIFDHRSNSASILCTFSQNKQRNNAVVQGQNCAVQLTKIISSHVLKYPPVNMLPDNLLAILTLNSSTYEHHWLHLSDFLHTTNWADQ